MNVIDWLYSTFWHRSLLALKSTGSYNKPCIRYRYFYIYFWFSWWCDGICEYTFGFVNIVDLTTVMISSLLCAHINYFFLVIILFPLYDHFNAATNIRHLSKVTLSCFHLMLGVVRPNSSASLTLLERFIFKVMDWCEFKWFMKTS